MWLNASYYSFSRRTGCMQVCSDASRILRLRARSRRLLSPSTKRCGKCMADCAAHSCRWAANIRLSRNIWIFNIRFSVRRGISASSDQRCSAQCTSGSRPCSSIPPGRLRLPASAAQAASFARAPPLRSGFTGGVRNLRMSKLNQN